MNVSKLKLGDIDLTKSLKDFKDEKVDADDDARNEEGDGDGGGSEEKNGSEFDVN